VKSDQGNLIERSQERFAIDFLLGSLEWTIAKNQGKMRAIYPLSSFLGHYERTHHTVNALQRQYRTAV
jgi:hypothetical protein